MAFIFGGDTGIADPQELQRRRAVIDALGQRAASAAPKNVGEGLSAIGQALAYRFGEKRLAKKEAAARKQATDSFGRVTSALLGGQGYASPPMPASVQGVTTPLVQSAPLTANPAGLPQEIIGAVDRVDPPIGGVTAETIKAGLVQRGLPQHVADAFVMNFQDESGLDPSVNEKAPLVPGSRGGFGLAQWTGPRRMALEQFAAARGASAADPNLQMDFLMTELQGPEAKAASSIFAAPDSATAAQAIVRDFLRPAPENMDRRVAEYGGFSAPPAMPGGDPQIINQLAELAANPYLPEGQRAVVDALMQKQLAQIGRVDDVPSDVPSGYRELEMRAQAAGLVPGTEQYQQFMLTGGSGIGEDRPAAFEALHQQALAAGLKEGSPEYQQFMLTRGAGDAAAAKALGQARGEAKAQINDALAKFEYGISVIDQIMNDPAIDAYTGNIQGRVPVAVLGQRAADLDAKAQQLQGQAFLQAFESLKGGGQITEIEGAKAEAAIARLQRTQSKEAYLAALQELRGIMVATIERAKVKAGMVSPAADPTDGGWTVIDGVRVREKQ